MPFVTSPTKQPPTVTYTVPIDPSILEDIERDAGKVAKEVEDMMRRLKGRMNDVSFVSASFTTSVERSFGLRY
jgi:hypothetical protein